MASWICPKCGGKTYGGFARCSTPLCGHIRTEFQGFEQVVGPDKFRCAFSGALTDVRLPGGDPISASHFLKFLQSGWLGADLSYTDKFYAAHPEVKRNTSRAA